MGSSSSAVTVCVLVTVTRTRVHSLLPEPPLPFATDDMLGVDVAAVPDPLGPAAVLALPAGYGAATEVEETEGEDVPAEVEVNELAEVLDAEIDEELDEPLLDAPSHTGGPGIFQLDTGS